MAKKLKLVIYGEPGTGKSTFAVHAPKPFFITTDGNYEWLEDWGAKEEDHEQVFTWDQAKKCFGRDFSKYETIVVDLTEDLFKWCEYEFCKKNALTHVADLGYGKGYDLTRNDFFIEISKLLALDKNIILIMHGLTITCKDRRGIEYSKYVPTNRIPDKLLDQIEGRVRYFLRAFATTEENESGHLVTRRYLSLSPDGTTEFGIARGIDTENTPRYIPLDWDTFYAIATKGCTTEVKQAQPPVEPIKVEKPKTEEPKKPVVDKQSLLNKIAAKAENKEVVEKPKTEEVKVEEPTPVVETPTPVVEEPIPVVETPVAVVETPTPVVEEPTPVVPQSNEDKLAAIKAKLAAKKLGK